MREILFRGKRTDNGEWVEGYFVINKVTQSHYIYLLDNSRLLDVDPTTVGQYTGLTDKNGVKIFEGDIVRVICDRDWLSAMAINPSVVGIGVIRWDMCAWCIETDFRGDKRYIHFPDAFCHFRSEVIGNIHDNPELLEG